MNRTKWIASGILGISSLFCFGLASAETDVEAQLQRLKTNMENSQKNYEQYRKNLDVVSQNIKESEKAIQDLKKLKLDLSANSNKVEENKKALDKAKLQVLDLKAKEKLKLEQEGKQLAELEAVMKKLQGNMKQREINLATYDAKVGEIENEKMDWDNQKKSMAELDGKISEKEKLAQVERQKWQAKKSDYSKETAKWETTKKSSSENYAKYKRLGE